MIEHVTIDELVHEARRLRDRCRRAVLAIAGPPGAGKTTLARAIVDHLNADPGKRGTAGLLPMDGFHLTNSALDERGLRHVKGAPQTFDVEGFVTTLRNIVEHPDEAWRAPGFSRVQDEPVPDHYTITPETRLVVAEGNYLLLPGEWAPIKELCAATWLLDIDTATERTRLIDRQVAENGRSPSEAVAFVDRSDLANAELVRNHSTRPDRLITLGESPSS